MFPEIFLLYSADAYDPLDPNGNITIKWDVMQWTADGYVVSKPLLRVWSYIITIIDQFNACHYCYRIPICFHESCISKDNYSTRPLVYSNFVQISAQAITMVLNYLLYNLVW